MRSRRNATQISVALFTCLLLGGCDEGSNTVNPVDLEPLPVSSVVVTPGESQLVALGATVQLSASAFDAARREVAGKAFSWTSSEVTVATVNETGLVSAVGNGEATITASVDGAEGRAIISVAQLVTSIVVTPDGATLTSLGETLQYSADALDANGVPVPDITITWESSDAEVAAIDESGTAAAISNGSTNVTASGRGVNGSVSLEVRQVAVQLSFLEVPEVAEAGEPFDPKVTVAGFDALGSLASTFSGEVSISVGENPNNGSLLGTSRVPAVNGVTTFENLSIDRDGAGYTLVATAPLLKRATSDPLEVTPCSPVNSLYGRTLCIIDPPRDSSGDVDVVKMVMDFDGTSGAYEIHLFADQAQPFVGEFRINLNLYNPDSGSFFQDALNDYNLSNPRLIIVLAGINPALRTWYPGDRVYPNSLDGTPNPPGSTLYRSSVGGPSGGFLTDEDLIAFARRFLPAIVH